MSSECQRGQGCCEPAGQTKGKVKQAIGDLTGNDDLKKEGKADERAGKTKEFIEDTKEKADDLVDTIKDKLTKH